LYITRMKGEGGKEGGRRNVYFYDGHLEYGPALGRGGPAPPDR